MSADIRGHASRRLAGRRSGVCLLVTGWAGVKAVQLTLTQEQRTGRLWPHLGRTDYRSRSGFPLICIRHRSGKVVNGVLHDWTSFVPHLAHLELLQAILKVPRVHGQPHNCSVLWCEMIEPVNCLRGLVLICLLSSPSGIGSRLQ